MQALSLAGCGGTTAPTQLPPPVTPATPQITCPAAQSAQAIDASGAVVTFTTPTVVNGQLPETTSCAPAAGTIFPVGQKTVTCTVTDSLQRTDSCSFVVTVGSPPKLASTTFLAFGDSITYGEDGQNSLAPSRALMSARVHPSVQFPEAQQYPYLLQQDLANRYRTQIPSVKNAGAPGEAAGDPATLVRFVNLVSTRQYSVALIMEGSNDIFYGDASQEAVAIAGLRQMIRSAKGFGVRPYLATVPPTNPPACDPVCRGRDEGGLVPGLNDSIRALALSESVTLVDVYQAFGTNLALTGPDGLHPSAAGYAKIADVFFQSIEQTLETSLPSSSSPNLRHSSARR